MITILKMLMIKKKIYANLCRLLKLCPLIMIIYLMTLWIMQIKNSKNKGKLKVGKTKWFLGINFKITGKKAKTNLKSKTEVY
jgi:hypothetical protein